MTPKKLTIKNFLSFEEATLNLEDKGLVAIEGVNLDGVGASSNGSGKSSLFISILWCLFGETDKDIASDEVVNSKAGKNCSVEMQWYDELNKQDIIITRYRAHSKHKNKLTISINGKDETKGTNVLTQALVNKTIGADSTVFKASCSASQENAIDIPSMNDKELKSLLENSLPFAKIEPLYKKYKDAYDTFVKEKARLENNLEQVKYANSSDLKAAMKADDQIVEWELAQANNTNDMKSLVKRREDLQERIIDTTSLEALRTRIRAKMDEMDISPIGALEASVRASKAILEGIRDNRPKEGNCPSCHQPFTSEKQREEFEADLLVKARTETIVLKANREELEKLEAYKPILLQLKTKLDEIDTKIVDNRLREKQLELMDERISSMVDAAKINVNPYRKIKQDYLDQIDKRKPHITNLEFEIQELSDQVDVYSNLKETFSPMGFKYQMLESITPRLNDRTNYYLSMLSDGEIKAIWSTVTKTASGYKEAFSIKASMNGRVGFNRLSGGQKRKVRLACWFALQDLIAERAEKVINLWQGDEIDNALDDAGIERLMSLLEERARDKGTVLVISHSSMRDWIANIVTVTMEDDVSTVKGFLCE